MEILQHRIAEALENHVLCKAPLKRRVLASIDLANEKHYSVIEIANLWALSEKTVRKIFEREPGVIHWCTEEKLHKRGYRTLRVPETILYRVHRKLRRAS